MKCSQKIFLLYFHFFRVLKFVTMNITHIMENICILIFIIEEINRNRIRSSEECTLNDCDSDLKIRMNYLPSLKKFSAQWVLKN